VVAIGAMQTDRAAPSPAQGRYAEGFEPVAKRFAAQLRRREQVGAALSVYQRGRQVVDLWGGVADVASARPWRRDTRIVVFSVTKGLVAMAMHLLADRGRLEWDAPIADVWPAFGRGNKRSITIRMLLNHRAGLAQLDAPLTLSDCTTGLTKVREALEAQRPSWSPGESQGYHAITFGLYAGEIFERLAGEPIGPFLKRELFDVVGSDARLGTAEDDDGDHATLYAPSAADRLTRMIGSAAFAPHSPEARIARSIIRPDSLPRRVFSNPSAGRRGVLAYNDVAVRRAPLGWASATASADGVARAYLPFASAGAFAGRELLRPETLWPIYERQSWSGRDRVLMKPLGWSQGFLKEERHIFCPNPESFGHAGMGGALGWCDPVEEIAIGYAMNHMDWRVRSQRALDLCHVLYECDPLRPLRR
jgi:CubicO group peptidase (beta-lactamase class C family)